MGDSAEVISDYDLVLITGKELEHVWEQHECTSKEIREITIQFSSDLFFKNFMNKNQFDSIRRMLEKAQCGISFPMQAIMKVYNWLDKLASEEQGFYAVMHFLRILYELSLYDDAKVLSSSSFAKIETFSDSRRVQKVQKYIADHYQEDIRLNTLADMVGMTPVSFSRFFRLRTGKTLSDYIIDIRLGFATRLLVDSAHTIAEICYDCGFNNLSNFNRMFKRKKDCSPKELRKISLLFGCLLCMLAATAQIRGNEIRVMVSPDHTDWNYRLNDKCTFTVRVLKAQNLLQNVTVDYELGPEMYPTEVKKGVLLKNGELKLQGTMKTPGFLRCKVTAHVGDRKYEGLATAAYAPEQLQPITEFPADFREFWVKELEGARRTSLQPLMTLLPERCTATVNVYHVSFQTDRWGSRFYGVLCVPKKEGKYPALLRVPGAGIRPYAGDVYTAEQGAITLEVGIHGIPVTMEQSFYDNLMNGALNGYWTFCRNDLRNFYYHRVIIGALRAVDFICELPQYNGQALGVTGSSQGWALSVMTAALDPRVTFCAAVHPALCDHEAFMKKRACGWPHYFYYYGAPDAKELEVVRYYDTASFARCLTVPGWFSWGYNDDVCPPTSMYAAYNAVTSPKELHPYLETGHYWYQEQWDEWLAWLWKQMGIGK